jgi:tetratricopeptide (TPR) repeat protein
MSQLIADDPKSEEAMDVRMFRGMIRVFCLKKDVEVGVADLTDYLDYYRGKKDKESSEAVDSASAMAYFVRGVYYAQQNDADKSLADLSEALREDLCLMEGEPGAHMLRGAIYLQKGDLEKAKADADAAIINNPPSSDAFLLRAAIFEKQGEKAKADADREQAKKIAKEGAENKWEDDDWTGEPIHTAIHSCLLKIVPTLEKR